MFCVKNNPSTFITANVEVHDPIFSTYYDNDYYPGAEQDCYDYDFIDENGHVLTIEECLMLYYKLRMTTTTTTTSTTSSTTISTTIYTPTSTEISERSTNILSVTDSPQENVRNATERIVTTAPADKTTNPFRPIMSSTYVPSTIARIVSKQFSTTTATTERQTITPEMLSLTDSGLLRALHWMIPCHRVRLNTSSVLRTILI